LRRLAGSCGATAAPRPCCAAALLAITASSGLLLGLKQPKDRQKEYEVSIKEMKATKKENIE